MAGNRTFTMIKPDAVAARNSGSIIQQIEAAGFGIIAMKKIHLDESQASAFYAVHKGKPFYALLVEFMSSGPIIPMILEKENAVADFRALIGSTNPANAAEGTIRKQFAKSTEYNAVHGADSDENALLEARFFFPFLEEITPVKPEALPSHKA